MSWTWKKGRTAAALVLGAAMVLPAAALAQRYESLRDQSGFVVTGQAGVTSYSGDAAALTTPGAAYGVNAGLDVTRLLGFELGYAGAVYQTQEGVEANQFTILENGAQGLITASPDIGMVEPYAFGGVKVNRLSVQEDEASSALANDSTQVKLPVGVGVNFNIDRDGAADWMIGARGAYDFTVATDAFAGIDNDGHNQLTGSLMFGGKF